MKLTTLSDSREWLKQGQGDGLIVYDFFVASALVAAGHLIGEIVSVQVVEDETPMIKFVVERTPFRPGLPGSDLKAKILVHRYLQAAFPHAIGFRFQGHGSDGIISADETEFFPARWYQDPDLASLLSTGVTGHPSSATATEKLPIETNLTQAQLQR